MIVRWIVAAVVGASLAACAPAADTAGGAKKLVDACAQSASQDIMLLAAAPDYVVDARSFDGPKPADVDAAAIASANPCANATVVLTVRRKEDGALVHGFATSMNRMDLIEGHAGPTYDGDKLRAFLEGWVKARVGATDTAPALPSETVTTTLDAAAYNALRAKKTPMLCHEVSVHDTQCFSIDPENAYELTPFYVEDHS